MYIYIFILFSYFLQGPWGAGAFLPGSIWGDHIPTYWEKSLAVPVQIRTLETAQFYSELGPLRLLLRLLRFLNAFKVLPKDLQHTAFCISILDIHTWLLTGFKGCQSTLNCSPEWNSCSFSKEAKSQPAGGMPVMTLRIGNIEIRPLK